MTKHSVPPTPSLRTHKRIENQFVTLSYLNVNGHGNAPSAKRMVGHFFLPSQANKFPKKFNSNTIIKFEDNMKKAFMMLFLCFIALCAYSQEYVSKNGYLTIDKEPNSPYYKYTASYIINDEGYDNVIKLTGHITKTDYQTKEYFLAPLYVWQYGVGITEISKEEYNKVHWPEIKCRVKDADSEKLEPKYYKVNMDNQNFMSLIYILSCVP